MEHAWSYMRFEDTEVRKSRHPLLNSCSVTAPTFSVLFERAQQGDWSARNLVYTVAFRRLRSIASSLLQRERRAHTLQPTALVSELFLKLCRLPSRVLNEEHFFHLSARAMRQVLIDYARTRSGGHRKVTADSVAELLRLQSGTDADPESLLAVKSVFQTLEKLDPIVARTVWLRSVEGLTLTETSSAQRRDVWRVRADYDFGVRWMADRITRHGRSNKSLRA
jgi:RNA polymerase sigma factor (TIGR02999 family)